MKVIRIYPEEVYNKDGIKIILVGKTKKKKYKSLVYQVLMRDKMERKWCSGDIFLAEELVRDPEVNHFQLLIELGIRTMHNSLKRELNEN
jgi:hypothetical protein